MWCAAGSDNSSGQPSDGEDCEEVTMDGLEGHKGSSALGVDFSEEHGTRLRTGRGGRGRGGFRGRGSRRRRIEADDDDVSEVTEVARVHNKRRKRGTSR